jgi:hypothetical protein
MTSKPIVHRHFSVSSPNIMPQKKLGRSENEIQDSQASLQNGIRFFLWGEIISGEDNDK